MTHVTDMLTAKNRHQLLNPTLGDRRWARVAFLPSLSSPTFSLQSPVARGNESLGGCKAASSERHVRRETRTRRASNLYAAAVPCGSVRLLAAPCGAVRRLIAGRGTIEIDAGATPPRHAHFYCRRRRR